MKAMDETLILDILTAPADDGSCWATYAACKDGEGMNFYPQNKREEAAALALCNACPVRQECLDHALATNERFGVWGGTTEKQRRKLSHIG
jgi:WhiB family redox-sensing transcriptional regulator